MIKAIFFDIDGTLLSHKLRAIPDSAKEAVAKLRTKGIKVLLASGRNLNQIDRLPSKELTVDGYITLNGQLCYDENRRLFYDNPIYEEDVKSMLTIFESKERPLMFIEENRQYINYVDDTVRKVVDMISTPVPAVGEYEGAKVYQMITFDDGFRAGELIEELSYSKISRWNPYAVDIIPNGGDKVVGIRRYLELNGISRSEIMAFGDGENDRDMLKFAGIGVAMGNAEAITKDAANYVTADVEEDGVVKALEYYGVL